MRHPLMPAAAAARSLILVVLAGTGLANGSLAGAALAAEAERTAPQQLPIEAQWCLVARGGGAPPCIALEVADETREQILGLQKRPPLPALHGMWFRYRQAQPVRFWMHQTPNPLDMIFLRDGRVIAIEAAAQPCPHLPCPSYGPQEPADGVVELAADQAAALGIAVGSPAPIAPLPARPAAGPSAP